jgi:hypothetical protein
MSRIGQKAAQPAKYLFGTDAEVANRDKTTHQPAATSFKQIGPEDGGGASVNDAPLKNIGDPAFKFDDPHV